MTNQIKRKARQRRVRSKISGTATIPRLNVFKSLTHVYLQLINDETGKTIVAVHDKELKLKSKKLDIAKAAGMKLAEKAIASKIETCVFDRGGYKYMGRVKAIADGAREGGLKF